MAPDMLPPPDAPPTVIRIPANQRVWRFGDVFSIWHEGGWWCSRNGARRAWSTCGAAEDTIALWWLNSEEW